MACFKCELHLIWPDYTYEEPGFSKDRWYDELELEVEMCMSKVGISFVRACDSTPVQYI